MQNNWKQLLIASTCFFIITQNSLSEAAEQQWLSASGKCRLQFVSTNYTCTSVVYGFGSGRTLFSVLADPGTSLQISFSGGVDRNVPPDIYELVVDRLVMSSTSSPKKNGLPIPNYIPVSGSCRANMPKAKPLSSVECWVSDKTGKQVTLTFIADNSPVASMSFDAKNGL